MMTSLPTFDSPPMLCRRALRKNDNHTGHFSTAHKSENASSAGHSSSRLALCDCARD